MQIFSRILRNQRTLRYQNNYFLIPQNILMLNQGLKTVNAEFIQTCALYNTTFFCVIQTLCNLVSGAPSDFDVNVTK